MREQLRRIGALACAAAVVVAAGGCGGDRGDSGAAAGRGGSPVAFADSPSRQGAAKPAAAPAGDAPNDAAYHIYIHADWSGSFQSSRAIEQGLMTALAPHGNTLGGRKVAMLRLDHRGNPDIHLHGLEHVLLKDPKALLVFTGLHSPPLIINRSCINEHEILTLVPWAAGSPITRGGPPNWVFRLSVDDKYVGRKIVDHAVYACGLRKFAVVVSDDLWGNFNAENIKKRLNELHLPEPGMHRISRDPTSFATKETVRAIARETPDAILMVVQPIDAPIVLRAMQDLATGGARFAIFSHWGVPHICPPRDGVEKDLAVPIVREETSLSFIQTSFSFLHPMDAFASGVFGTARRMFPEITSTESIRPATGFIHAHDLGVILAAAGAQAALTGNVRDDRRALKEALESLVPPVRGLIKTYVRPFRPYRPEDEDAHEALSFDDLVMARFDARGNCILPAPAQAGATGGANDK